MARGVLVRKLIAASAGGRVASGPFTGMRLECTPHTAETIRYLLGTHESELHATVAELCRMPFDTILNVGAADGYYVVGLALRVPSSKVLAFEMNPDAQQRVQALAQLNAVDERVEVLGRCDGPLLAQRLTSAGRTLVVMDVEGAEAELLDPAVAPLLRDASILVEVHDYVDRQLGDLIRTRFASTHELLEIWSKDRTLADFPLRWPRWKLTVLGRQLVKVMWERRREKMRWFYLKPHKARAGTP